MKKFEILWPQSFLTYLGKDFFQNEIFTFYKFRALFIFFHFEILIDLASTINFKFFSFIAYSY